MTPLRNSTSRLALALAAMLLLVGDRPARPDIVPPDTAPLLGDASARDPGESSMGVAPAPARFRLSFTAPMDAPWPDSGTAIRRRPRSVHAYEVLQVDPFGITTIVRGYADSLGLRILTPHRPGTRETVWLDTTDRELAKTIFVLSRGWSGNASRRSNGYAIAAVLRAGSVGQTAAGH